MSNLRDHLLALLADPASLAELQARPHPMKGGQGTLADYLAVAARGAPQTLGVADRVTREALSQPRAKPPAPERWEPQPGEVVACIDTYDIGKQTRMIRFRKIERVTKAFAWVDGVRYSRPRNPSAAEWDQTGYKATYYGSPSIAKITPELKAERQQQRDLAELHQLRRALADAALGATDAKAVKLALACLGVSAKSEDEG